MNAMVESLTHKQARERFAAMQKAVREELEAWRNLPAAPQGMLDVLAANAARRCLRTALRYDAKVRRGLK